MFHNFCLAFHFVDLVFALIVAPRRYKQMATSQKSGDILRATFVRSVLHDAAHENA
jgi:hypothetical protein